VCMCRSLSDASSVSFLLLLLCSVTQRILVKDVSAFLAFLLTNAFL
jgi:hypothetical protein